MKWSLNLGRISGIRILVHWTFLLLISYVVFLEMNRGSDTVTILLTVGFVLSIFACVVLHELGHALAARKYGIGTKKITLLPIGGVASLESMPEDPKQELVIAIAGPAVNVVIAAVLWLIIPFGQINIEEEIGVITRHNFLLMLFTVNVVLVIFNAIPAFPMDGGRVLRAALAMKMDRVKATNIASKIGQLVSIGFVFIGLFGGNFFLVFIGIFVFYAAYAENIHVQHFDLLKGYEVRDAMMTKFLVLSPEETVKDAVDKLLAGSDQDFLVIDSERVLGIVSTGNILAALKENMMDKNVTEIMRTNFTTFDAGDKLTDVFVASQKMKESFFPVMENQKLAGVINQNNVHEFLMVQSVLKQ